MAARGTYSSLHALACSLRRVLAGTRECAQVLKEGDLKSWYLCPANNHDVNNPLAGSCYVSGTVLHALRILFHLILTTVCKVEGIGLLSHLRVVQVHKC